MISEGFIPTIFGFFYVIKLRFLWNIFWTPICYDEKIFLGSDDENENFDAILGELPGVNVEEVKKLIKKPDKK